MRNHRFVGARIFIVDDEPANVRILERLLKQEGFLDLVGMTDARKFAAHCEATPPDLVLLDLLMPHVSGFEILAWLAERTVAAVRPPVLVLTADVTRQTRERALAGGAMDFVTKPFDHFEVLLRVRNLLTRHFLELDLWEHNQVLESRITERTRELQVSLDQLRETSRQRQDLTLRLVTAQEEERRRIAADVHDGPVQALVALGIRLDLLARRLADPEARAEMERLRTTASETLTGLRTLMLDLRPPALDRDGLEAALREYQTRMEATGGPAVALIADLRTQPPAELGVVLFRIAQEALANVRRHAAASEVTVTLADDGEGVRLTVRDDGRGFDPERAAVPGHLGLATMQERATIAGGWCRVESAPGAGATVTAWVPLAPGEPGSTG
jgi:signal transduction histidine kinase